MSAQLKVLYVGGTGTISASCVRASVASGQDVYVLNRGLSSARPLPPEVTVLTGDVTDSGAIASALADRHFDAIVNVTVFTPDQASQAVSMFKEATRQYVHISTAALYQKPVLRMPYTEPTPRHNPFSAYARDKIAAEDVFTRAYDRDGFPVTIVRPSHTYDDVKPPLPGDWTIIDRICRGAEVIVPGDGTSLWTLTHAVDFAVGLTGLLGNTQAVGETFHITSDFVYTWDQIYSLVAKAAGVEPRLVHVPSEFLPVAAPDWRWSELITGDLMHSVVFDNSKIRRYVPEYSPRIGFDRAIEMMLDWRKDHPAETKPDPAVDTVMDRLVTGYRQSRQIFAALSPPSGSY